jgi:hypothetical protein
MPALQCLLGPDLVTLPYKTAPSHNADHHEYPQWFQFFNKGKEATFVAKTETGGQKEQRWEAMTLPEVRFLTRRTI